MNLKRGQKPVKPRSKLERWIRQNGGPGKISEKLGVVNSAVQHWCAGRAAPSLENATKLCLLSKGKLSVADIFEGTKPQ